MLCPGHRMWLGQFQLESNPNANSGNYTLPHARSNSQPVTNSYPDASAIERCDHWTRG